MTSLEHQLLEERHAKQRQYVRANTRARWGFVGFGAVLLVIVTKSPWIALAFAASFAAANAGVRRLVRRAPFRPWYAQLNLVVGCLMISALLYAMGPNGHVLYAAYLIAPLQAALYLGRREAWGALSTNLAAFALVTALRQAFGPGAPGPTLATSVTVVGACAAVLFIAATAIASRKPKRSSA